MVPTMPLLCQLKILVTTGVTTAARCPQPTPLTCAFANQFQHHAELPTEDSWHIGTDPQPLQPLHRGRRLLLLWLPEKAHPNDDVAPDLFPDRRWIIPSKARPPSLDYRLGGWCEHVADPSAMPRSGHCPAAPRPLTYAPSASRRSAVVGLAAESPPHRNSSLKGAAKGSAAPTTR